MLLKDVIPQHLVPEGSSRGGICFKTFINDKKTADTEQRLSGMTNLQAFRELLLG